MSGQIIKTSWIIRTKNEEKWLKSVIEMLYRQSKQDFEIIVVDSGSTDKTLEIISQFPEIVLIKILQGDFNYSYALNLGISKSKGEFIGILSGHSLPPYENWYENALKNFEDNSVVGVSSYYLALPDGSILEKLVDFPTKIFHKKRTDKFYNMTNTNSIIRKRAWDEYHYDESLIYGCEDYDWACEMISRGYKIVRDPNFFVYHSHGGMNRPEWLQKMPIWRKAVREIDKKNRPTKTEL